MYKSVVSLMLEAVLNYIAASTRQKMRPRDIKHVYYCALMLVA